ncbi:hypothetical protein TSACC_2150 [Terrimicrobium sacchariphilum]|uniref:Glycosyl transferases group 1 n=2 Tax=Terrimicrobium sacchariphilum TaxID=690879 RepID=A0A146G4P7_TERSA|nr:hypothetical protein TSACC_2150 [Terrimicrobium sacchariphilum]
MAAMCRRLGFQVTWSKTVEPCSLLVVMRGERFSQNDIGCLPEGTPAVVFGYVGKSCEEILHSLRDRAGKILFLPTSQKLVPQDIAGINVHVAPPPVYPELWKKELKAGKYPYTYLGNRKNLGDDPWQKRLEGWIKGGDVEVWGRWWNGHCPVVKQHGPVTIFTVPEIYRSTIYSLGLMYPFQRDTGMFSGRYWLAPLCGAHVLVECENYCEAPGIVLYQGDVLPDALDDLDARRALQGEAVSFWRQKTAALERVIQDWLKNLDGKLDLSRRPRRAVGLKGDLVTMGLKASSIIESIALSRGKDLSPLTKLGFWK